MQTNPHRRKLIVLEGIDGVGKTTLSHMLVQEFNRQKPGLAVRFEDLPFNNPTRTLRAHCQNAGNQSAAMLTYIVSAMMKDQLIRELLTTRHVIMDRFIYSALAHHKAQGVDIDVLNLDHLPILRPDHSFLFLTDEPVRRARLEARGNMTAGDRRVKSPGSELEIIENCFRELIETHVDTTPMTPEQTLQHILELMNLRRPASP